MSDGISKSKKLFTLGVIGALGGLAAYGGLRVLVGSNREAAHSVLTNILPDTQSAYEKSYSFAKKDLSNLAGILGVEEGTPTREGVYKKLIYDQVKREEFYKNKPMLNELRQKLVGALEFSEHAPDEYRNLIQAVIESYPIKTYEVIKDSGIQGVPEEQLERMAYNASIALLTPHAYSNHPKHLEAMDKLLRDGLDKVYRTNLLKYGDVVSNHRDRYHIEKFLIETGHYRNIYQKAIKPILKSKGII